jgi:ABC-2 type transport system permease protein
MGEASGIYALWYREIKVFTRERSRVISSLVSPLMWLVIFGTGLGTILNGAAVGGDYQTFIYPGIIAMTVLFGSLFFGLYVVWDKKIDFLKEVLVAPISRTSIFFGKVLGGATDSAIEVAMLMVLGIFFGVHFTLLSALATLVLAFIMIVGIVSIGLTIGSYMSSPEGFGLVSSFVIFPLFFLSGALFPVKSLPSWLYAFVLVNPVTYGVDALRGVILGIHQFNILYDLSIMLAFAVIMVAIGTYSFKRMKL